jgi:hypothetical protein
MGTEATQSMLAFVSGVSTDVFALLGCTLLLMALGLKKGKDILITFIFALYPSALITAHFPFYTQLDILPFATGLVVMKLIVFIAIFSACVFVIAPYIDTGYQQHAFWRFVEMITLSVTTLGLLGAILYHFIEVEKLYNFSIVLDTLFSTPLALGIWLIAPIVALPLFVRP